MSHRNVGHYFLWFSDSFYTPKKRKTIMATNPVPRRKPTAKKPVRPAPAVKQPAVKPVTVSNVNTSNNTNTQLAKQVQMKDKEIAMLKQQIVKQEKKLSVIKSVAVQMAMLASKNNAIKAGQILDWGNKIMNAINGR